MKSYTMQELISISYDNPKQLLELENYFKGLATLTEKDEYTKLHRYICEITQRRLNTNITDNLIKFVMFNEYKLVSVDTNDDNTFEGSHKLIIGNDTYDVSEYSYRHISYLAKTNTDTDDLYRANNSLSDCIEIIEDSIAYKVICRINEKNRLEFEMKKKDNVIKRLINKI